MINFDEENRPVITRIINGESIDISIMDGEAEDISAQQKNIEIYNQVVDTLSGIMNKEEYERYISDENEEYLLELIEIIDETRHDLINQNFDLLLQAALYQLDKNGLSQSTSAPNYKELIYNSLNYSEQLIEED